MNSVVSCASERKQYQQITKTMRKSISESIGNQSKIHARKNDATNIESLINMCQKGANNQRKNGRTLFVTMVFVKQDILLLCRTKIKIILLKCVHTNVFD